MENLYLEVNLYNIDKNIGIIRNILGNKKFIAVVKGDAYGLGIHKICDFIKEKVDLFGVSDIDEAITLYNIGIENEILILTPIIMKEYFKNPLIEKFTVTIDNREILYFIPKELNINAHIYVCTGMNRKGIKIEELNEFIRYVENNYNNINITGIYTHLHNAKDEKYTLNQIDMFKNAVLKYKGKYLIHVLNSKGFINKNIRERADFCDGIRIGNLIYGYDGSSLGISKSFNYYSKVISSYMVKKGEYGGYGNKVKLKDDTNVCILGIGNIHHIGFYREFKRNFIYDLLKFVYRYFVKPCEIYKGNTRVKILGSSNMNLTLVDGEGLEIGDYLKVCISPILGDSSIHKKYIIKE